MKYLFKLYIAVMAVSCMAMFLSCSDDDEHSPSDIGIEFSQSEYKIKVGKSITIGPTISNAKNPVYSWKLEGKIISIDPHLVFENYRIGEYFITLRIDDEGAWNHSQIDSPRLHHLPTNEMVKCGHIERLFSNSSVSFNATTCAVELRE